MAFVPEHIGPYRVLRPIASGGMAEVYEVQDPASGESLALKLLVAVRAALKRFDREYEAMTRLNHPSIVRVYHYGLHHGHPWLTMELLRGVPTQSHIKRIGRPGTPQRLREVLRIGYHVSKALHYVHLRGLVHRDLKSANVLVLPDDRIKLLDFGAAHLIDGERITRKGEFVGTFAYASPEQILGQPIDHRSDLYSLGVLLFRLATGRRPFPGRDNEVLIRQHLNEPAPDPSELVPSVPKELCLLINALLAKPPEARPQSAERVAVALEALNGRAFTTRSRLAVHASASASRGLERQRVWDHLTEGPPATLVVISGEDGSDRSRLLELLQLDARERGWAAYRCAMSRANALWRLLQALLEMTRDCGTQPPALPRDEDPGGPLAPDRERLLSTLSRYDDPAALINPDDRATLRQAAVSLARLRTHGGHPTLLLVQEIHRADPLTLELIGGLRRALQEEDVPLKVVVSCRTSEAGGALARRLGVDLDIELQPLSPREIAVAMGNMLGRRPPTAELARRLHTITGGQPLYLEEAVAVLVAGGGIEAEGNRLAWADQATEIPCPELAKTAADGVLRDLPVLWRRLLEALAVIDDAASAPLLAEVLGWEPDPVITILEGLDRRGVLRWTPDQTPTLAWRHPRLAPLLLERMHPSRRAALHRSLALAMTDRAPSHSAVAALMAVGDLEQAARIATSLATELLQGHRVRSAQELLEPLVDALRSTDQTIEIAEVLLSYTCCLQRIHPTDPRNVRTLLRVREIAEACADPILQVRVDLAQARLYQNIGHYGNYLKYLLAGWEHLSSTHDPALTAALATELARSHRWRGDVPKAEGWVEEALVAAEASGRLSLLGDAVVQSGACMLARGQLSDAEQAYGLAMEDYERGFDRPGYFVALARWASSLRLQGRYSEALAQLYRHLPEASQLQDPAAYVELLQSTAWVELDLSRLGRAQECTDELTATISKGEHLHLRLETQLLTGRILLASGQPQMASYLLQQVQQRARNAELSVLAEAARSLLAETMFALGDHRTAATLFQSAILGLLGSGDLAVLAEGVRACARTQATRRDPSDIFRPVERLVEEQPMTLLKLEQLLAYGAWYRARGERERSRQSFREAAMVLNVLATSLNDTDRAALRVHPWSTWIRRGLRQGHR